MFWIILILLLFILQIAAVLIAEFRNPEKSVAWLSILFIVPVFGFLVYYFIAKEYRTLAKVRRGRRKAEEEGAWNGGWNYEGTDVFQKKRLEKLLRSLPEASVTGRNNTVVLSSAQEMYERMLQDIERAEHHIHMQYYIWNDDEWGRTFQQMLIRKALQGVEVRILFDGIGTYHVPEAFWCELRAVGGFVFSFLPPFFAFFDKRLNYRNHRKITVIDGTVGYVGGINIGDEYAGKNPKMGYWRDTAIRFSGPAVYDLQRIFLKDWRLASGKRLQGRERLFPPLGAAEAGPDHGQDTVQIISSGPDLPRHTIHEMYFAACCIAEERIYVTTPYLIPDRSLLVALKTAALSGIDVRIVMPGITDSRLTLWASLSYVEELLRAGVRIFRYRKGFLHAKRLIVDRYFATTGSANMDIRSFFSNFEVNAAFFDEHNVGALEAEVIQDFADSEEILLEPFMERNRTQRMKETFGRLISPLL